MVIGVALLFAAVAGGDDTMATVGSSCIGVVSVSFAVTFAVTGALILHAMSRSKFTERGRLIKLFGVILAFSLAWIGSGLIW